MGEIGYVQKKTKNVFGSVVLGNDETVTVLSMC